jgi:hypothetical protein
MKHPKKIALYAGIVILILAVIAFVRFSSSEDAWVCENGEWAAHGNPSAPKPTEGCGNVVSNQGEPSNIQSVTGTILRQDGKVVLIYEKPGAPALLMDLDLGEETQCLTSSEEKCVVDSFTHGSRVEVSGTIDNNLMKVLKLQML